MVRALLNFFKSLGGATVAPPETARPTRVSSQSNLRKALAPYQPRNPPPDEVSAKARLMWLYLKADTFSDEEWSAASGYAASRRPFQEVADERGRRVAAAMFTLRQINFLEGWLRRLSRDREREAEAWRVAEELDSRRKIQLTEAVLAIGASCRGHREGDPAVTPEILEEAVSFLRESLRADTYFGNVSPELVLAVLRKNFAPKFANGKSQKIRFVGEVLSAIGSCPALLRRLTAA
jgi:hypothetical protein